jgi:catechol 2,3-dioxygenase-like lactoylglutathione lyase family enzyme
VGIKFDAISLFVNDLKIMVEFYRDVLGVNIEWDGTGPHVDEESYRRHHPVFSGGGCNL